MGLTRRGLRDAEMALQNLKAATRYKTETAVAFGGFITMASTAA
jgi:hypothetical protein